MIINELLSYTLHYLEKSTIENIRKVLSNFYTLDEVKNSKKLLWDVYKDDLTDYQDRKSTENRSAKDSHLDDIFKALKTLDELSRELKFVAHDLDRIPSFNPEELNTTLLLERVNLIEKKLKSYDETLSNQRCDIMLIQNKLDSEKCDKNDIRENIAIKTGTFKSDNDSLAISSINSDKVIPKIDSDNSIKLRKRHNSDSVLVLKPKQNLSDLSKQLVNDNNLPTSVAPTKFYSYVKKDKNTYNRSVHNNYRNQERKFRRDSSFGQTFRSSFFRSNFRNSFSRENQHNWRELRDHKLTDIFLYKAENVEGTDIINYCRKKGITINDVKKVSHPQARYLSFRIGVRETDAREILRKNFWPIGVGCRPFKYLK